MSAPAFNVRSASNEEILPLRTRHRAEMNCQIVHDSVHRRAGWTSSYLIEWKDLAAGFSSVALGGPWKDKPTLFEFYLLPQFRTDLFHAFDAFRAASRPAFLEVQTNDTPLFTLACTFGANLASEKIVFRDHATTKHPPNGALLRSTTPDEEISRAIDARQDGGEWMIELNGTAIGKGGMLFHYNRPYADLYMEIDERHRRRGFGQYLVQELKRECYRLGAIPCARCNPTNIGSRGTLQAAGFTPFAHILNGTIPPP